MTETEEKLEFYRTMCKYYEGAFEHIHPVKVFYSPLRGNTTIIFKDGSCERVKLKEGEDDCIDTAIAYALVKHVYPKEVLKKLIVENTNL